MFARDRVVTSGGVPLHHLTRYPQLREQIRSLCIRWFTADGLSIAQVETLLQRRGIMVSRNTLKLWGQGLPSAPLAFPGQDWHWDEKRLRIHRRPHYLYRALSPQGHLLDLMLVSHPQTQQARRLFATSVRRSPRDRPTPMRMAWPRWQSLALVLGGIGCVALAMVWQHALIARGPGDMTTGDTYVLPEPLAP